MLRLAPPGFERFLTTPLLAATFGGGEANVAVSLANFGLGARYVTALPANNPMSDAFLYQMRGFGVDSRRCSSTAGRFGVYSWKAAPRAGFQGDLRPRPLLDLAGQTGRYRLGGIFDGAAWFHMTGITPAMTQSCADLALEAVEAARAAGSRSRWI